jgi:hypothetical protein
VDKHIDTIILSLAEQLQGHDELKRLIYSTVVVSPLLDIENLPT